MINADTHIITDESLFTRLQKYVEKNKSPFLVLDVETDSQHEKIANLYGIGLCLHDKKAFYIPWRKPTGEMFWTEEQQNIIKTWLYNVCKTKKVIGHNILFDVLVIENNLGYDLTEFIYSDTILLKHALDEERPFALKEIAKYYLGDWADKAQDDLKQEVLAKGGKWNKEQKDMYLASTKTLGYYCNWDVILTYKLFVIFEKELYKEGLQKLFYEDETMPLYKEVTINMKRRGFPVDIPHYERLKVELQKEIADIEDKIMAEIKPYVYDFEQDLLHKECPVTGGGNFSKVLAEIADIPLPKTKAGKITLAQKALDAQRKATPQHQIYYDWIQGQCAYHSLPDEFNRKAQTKIYLNKKQRKEKNRRYVFNLNSSDQLAYLLFDQLGIPCKKRTDSGKPSTKADILDEIIEKYSKKYKFLNILLDYRKLNKLLSTYVIGILDRQIDSVIYTSMLQYGTTSGRYASRNPNLQNQSSHKDEDSGLSPLVIKYTNAIRAGFKAPEGYKIINSDYSSLEPMCFATMSGDKRLQEVFHKGEDIYSRVAIDVFKIKGVSANKKSDNYLKKISPESRGKSKTFCFTESGIVLTDEFKTIKNVKIGEYIQGYDGVENFSYKIINKQNRESEVVNFVTSKGGFKCTPDHKIWSIDNNCWKEAKYFEDGEKVCLDKQDSVKFLDYKNLPIYSNASFKNKTKEPLLYLTFDEKWAWILGAFLGDGIGSYTRRKNCAAKGHNSHLISSYVGICGLSDDLVTSHWQKFFEDKGYKFSIKRRDNKFDIFTVSDFELVKIFQNTLQSFTINPTRKNLKVPNFVYNSPISVKVAFLAGLLDTDGYVKSKHGKTKTVNLCSKEWDLISGLSKMLTDLNVEHSTILDWNKTYKRYYYIINIYHSGIKILNDLGLSKFLKCPRKKEAVTHIIHTRIRNNKNIPRFKKIINLVDKEKVYDITVETKHEFCLNGFRVHNCLAVPYGAEAGRIAQSMEVDYKTAAQTINQYLKTYPNLKKYMKKCERDAKIKGKVKTIFGRVRHLKRAASLYTLYGEELLDAKYARMNGLTKERWELKNLLNNAKNFPIQGLAAHIVNRAMIAVAREFIKQGIDGYVALQVHDEIPCIVREDQAEQAAKILQECMENIVELAVPLKAEPLIADRWSEAK